MDGLAILAVSGVITGLFVLGAFRLAGAADDRTEQAIRDHVDGDCFPYAPQVFPSHERGDSR